MRILILGGSNSVSAHGYTHFMVSHLETSFGICPEITNLSVGGTTTYSAVARLHEAFRAGTTYDIVIYEYSLNDTGHFNHRKHGVDYYALALSLLVESLAKLHGNTIFLPILFASQPFYDTDIHSSIYDYQVELFNRIGLSHVDIRYWLRHCFGPQCPDFVYADIAHYHWGAVSTMVGSLVAERAAALCAAASRVTAQDLALRLAQQPGVKPRPFRCMTAGELAPFARGPHEHLTRSNTFMTLDVLRLHPGSTLRLNNGLKPFCLSLASDTVHRGFRFQNGEVDENVSSLYADLKPDQFLYSNLPLALLGERSLTDLDWDTTRFSIDIPADLSLSSARAFDCFVTEAPQPNEPNRLDVTSLLLVGDR